MYYSSLKFTVSHNSRLHTEIMTEFDPNSYRCLLSAAPEPEASTCLSELGHDIRIFLTHETFLSEGAASC